MADIERKQRIGGGIREPDGSIIKPDGLRILPISLGMPYRLAELISKTSLTEARLIPLEGAEAGGERWQVGENTFDTNISTRFEFAELDHPIGSVEINGVKTPVYQRPPTWEVGLD